jgi:outer membrane protein assembly factor BamB
VFKRVWTYPIHHAFGAFAADGDDCFVAARHTKLVSVGSETGQVRWSASIESPYGWLAFNDRSVFYLNQHAHLIAVDRKTGEHRWSRMLEGINGWLHALGTTVVVGGWRGYTDILAIDGDDGKTRWTRSARNRALHSTRIHAESSTLVVAELEDKRIRFVRLADGVEISQAPVDWDVQFTERPTGTTRCAEPLVIQSSGHQFLAITGTNPDIEVVAVEANIWSQNISSSGAVVPFLTSRRELLAWHLVERRMLNFGLLQHNRRDILPFCQVSADSFVVGTSFGELRHFTQSGKETARSIVGKRIATEISLAGTIALCGTDSGELIGVETNIDG